MRWAQGRLTLLLSVLTQGVFLVCKGIMSSIRIKNCKKLYIYYFILYRPLSNQLAAGFLKMLLNLYYLIL